MMRTRSSGFICAWPFDPEDGHQRIPGDDPQDHEDGDGDPDEGTEGEKRLLGRGISAWVWSVAPTRSSGGGDPLG